MNELNKCGCGGVATVTHAPTGDYNRPIHWVSQCRKCHSGFTMGFDTKPEAIEAWNRANPECRYTEEEIHAVYDSYISGNNSLARHEVLDGLKSNREALTPKTEK